MHGCPMVGTGVPSESGATSATIHGVSSTVLGLRILAAVFAVAGATVAVGFLVVDVPNPQAYSCISSHVPGADECVRLTCGSVIDPSITSRFDRRGATPPTAQQLCDAQYGKARTRAMIAFGSGAGIGIALLAQSRWMTGKREMEPSLKRT